MTKEEFENDYANGSGIPLDELKKLGLQAFPCDCDYENCNGWQMLSSEHSKEIMNNQLRHD